MEIFIPDEVLESDDNEWKPVDAGIEESRDTLVPVSGSDANDAIGGSDPRVSVPVKQSKDHA